MSSRRSATKALSLVLALLCAQQAVAAPHRARSKRGRVKAPVEAPATPEPTAPPSEPVTADKPSPPDKPPSPPDKPVDKPADKPALPPSAPPLDKSAPPAAPSKPAAKEKKAPRLRVTILPLLEKNFPEPTAVALQRELSDGLRRNGRLDMKDLDVRLAEFAQEVPFEQVELARTTYQNGQESLRNLNLDQAAAQLADAVDQLVAVLPYIKKQELADAMLALAVVQQQKGNLRAMQATLKRLLIWRSNYELDTSVFPQQISEPLQEARAEVGQLPLGQIKVLCEPSGSQVFVDGDFAGVAPTQLNNLTVGEHYVTFKKLGYKRGLRIATVTGGPPIQVLGKLPRAEKYLLVEQAIERVGPKIEIGRAHV